MLVIIIHWNIWTLIHWAPRIRLLRFPLSLKHAPQQPSLDVMSKEKKIGQRYGGGGGGFFLACENLGGIFNYSFPTCNFFFFFFEISLRTLIPLFVPGSVHGGSAILDNCGCMFPDKLSVSWFPWGSQIMPGQHSQPTQTSLGQGCVHV